MAFPDRWTTARLRAERLTPDHLGEVCRMHQDAEVMTWLGGVQTESWSAAYLERNLRHWDQYGFGLWILYPREGSRPIGRGLLRHLDLAGVREIEVGYAFYREHWGRGLATEIARACVRHGHEHLGAETLVAVTHPENDDSQQVLRKAGFLFDRTHVLDGETRAIYRVRGSSGAGAL
jgi:RimJ/RimL family protein N-acetyltransferase